MCRQKLKLVLAVLAVTWAHHVASQIPNHRHNQPSLLIVFDDTGSMSKDLVQLRQGAKELTQELSRRTENPIYNYVLSVFNSMTHVSRNEIKIIQNV